MTIILFLVFNLALHFFFRGLLIGIKLLRRKNYLTDSIKVFGIPLYILYPPLTLFIIGNLTLILNFFTNGNQIKIFLAALFLLCLSFNTFENLNMNKFFIFISFLAVPSILSISSFGINIHYDAIDYHLNHQSIILNEKLIIGLSNAYTTYGWSTIYEYIQAVFFYKDNLVFLHYLNLIFFNLMYSFIFYFVFINQNLYYKLIGLNLLLFSFLDNFGIGGGGNAFIQIQMIGKVDIAFGVVFSLTYFLFLHDVIKNEYKRTNFFYLSFLVLFCIQLKVFGVYLLVPYIFYFFKLSKLNDNSLLLVIKQNLLAIFLGIAYLVKNILISGCLIFPLSSSCLTNLIWADAKTIRVFSEGVRFDEANNIAYKFSYQFSDWFDTWINHAYNQQIHTNFLGSLILIFIFNKLFFVSKAESRPISIYNLLYLVFLIGTFILTGPTFRYGFGIYILIIGTLSISVKKTRFTKLKFNFSLSSIILIIFIVSVGATPRLYSYKQFIEEPLDIYTLTKNDNTYLQELIDLNFNESKFLNCYIPELCERYDLIEISKLNYRVLIKSSLELESN